MELGDDAGQRVDRRGGQFAALGEPVQPLRVVEAMHAQRPVDGRAGVAADARRIECAGDRLHVDIDLRRGAPVQAQFLFAVGAALRRRREVEEVECQRLAQLVDLTAGHHEAGDGGLQQRTLARRHGERQGVVQERLDQACLLREAAGVVVGDRHGRSVACKRHSVAQADQ